MRTHCPFCGSDVIPGTDHCEVCLASFTTKDLPKPKKQEPLQKDIMTKPLAQFIPNEPILMVDKKASIQDVIDTLQSNPVHGCVLICDNNKKLQGIVSIRDILHKVAGKIKSPEKKPVTDIMTNKVETLSKDMPLGYALHKMSIGRFRHIPIVDKEERVIGVVSMRTIIPYLSKQ